MAAPSRSKQNATHDDLSETVVTGGDDMLGNTNVDGDAPPADAPKQPAQAKKPLPKQVAQKSAGHSKENQPKKKSGGKKATQLGDFKLIKKLGQGGMGTVYLGHQVSLDRNCAVKVLSKEMAERPGFVERFIREARSMAKIDHPNVVKCFAVGESHGYNYVAMELMNGQSMEDWTDQLGTLSIADAVLVTLVCAEALEHAHGLNMIHRDVKPDNILVSKEGKVKVSDMGLAKAVDDDDMSMTQSGTGLGTPHYMPPEQARNAKHVDRRCDIYALGVTLYHFLTGKLPFAGDSVLELIMAKEKGQFTPAKRHNPKVPEKLDLIIDKAMARDPEHRYPTCAEFITDLEGLGLAGTSLSFIDSESKVALRGAGTGGGTMVGGPGQTMVSGAEAPKPKKRAIRTVTSADDAARNTKKRPADSTTQWYVREKGSGRPKMSKMTTAQILQSMKTDRLDMSTQVSRTAKGTYYPLAQVPVFEDEAKKLVARQMTSNRRSSMAEEYAKAEKQLSRQKWWRLLARFRDGTLGMVGLIVWLALIAAVIVGLYFGYQYAADMIAENVNLK